MQERIKALSTIQRVGLILGTFFVSMCCFCCGWLYADTTLRNIGILPSLTPQPTVTELPTDTPTQTHTPSPTNTPTPTSSTTPTFTATATPLPTPTPTHTPSITPTPSVTPTPSITPTPSQTLTPSRTPTLTPSKAPTPSRTLTPSRTFTPRPVTNTPLPPAPGGCTTCGYNALNCSDFSTHDQAQACYNYCLQIVGYDVHDLDRDGDGSACESLP